MPQPDVIYLIEHVARELDIACAVRCLARGKYGLEVEIRSLLGKPNASSTSCHRTALATPYLYSGRDAGVRDWLERRPGMHVVNLAFEQLFSEGNKVFKRPRDRIARRHATHLASGGFFRAFLVEHGVDLPHIAVTGNLSCGLYQAPYRAYFAGRREEFARQYRLDAEKPWVFFPENFGAAFFGESAIRQRLRQGASPQDLYDYRDFARASFRAIMPWCRDAAETGKIELIIRPRPSSRCSAFVDAYREAAGTVPARHLHFIKDHSVREWNLASDLVVSSYSSTLVEAAVAEKPVFLLAPVPFCRSVQTEWCDVPPLIERRDQFLDTVLQANGLHGSSALRQWAMQHLLEHGDPIGNLVDLFVSIRDGSRHLPPVPPAVSWLERTSRRMRDAGRYVGRIARVRLRQRNSVRSAMHENDRFTQQDVDQRTDRWQEVLFSGHHASYGGSSRPVPDAA